jgi:prepilin-type N-terminal cleavage/methylation domain-containing protein
MLLTPSPYLLPRHELRHIRWSKSEVLSGRLRTSCFSAVPPAPTFSQRGFTLTELAVVMVIVALLIGGMLLPLSAQQDIRAQQDTEKVLGEAKDALLGYVVVNGYLPCPDTDDDGAENVSGSGSTRVCASPDGDFPYQTVGTSQADGFNLRLRYRVTADFAKTFSLSTVGDITVIARGDDPNTPVTTESKKENNLVTTAPAVILSVGKNGYGGMPKGGGTRRSDPAGADELLNKTGSKKVSRTPTPGATGCGDNEVEATPLCEFDDQVVWLSTNTIFSRMISAGRLP